MRGFRSVVEQHLHFLSLDQPIMFSNEREDDYLNDLENDIF